MSTSRAIPLNRGLAADQRWGLPWCYSVMTYLYMLLDKGQKKKDKHVDGYNINSIERCVYLL